MKNDKRIREKKKIDWESVKQISIGALGLISLISIPVTIGIVGGMHARNAITLDELNLEVSGYREEISNEVETSFGIKDFNVSNISFNSQENTDYVKLFGTKGKDNSKEFTNIYVSMDEESTSKIFEALENNIEYINDKEGELKWLANVDYKQVSENRALVVSEVIKIINSATEADYYVENIGDVQVIKNYFNEILTGEKVTAINNGVYGDENKDFSIGNVLISDIRKEEDSFVIDFVGLDEDLLFSKGVTSAGIGLSGSGLGLYVGTSNGTRVEEVKQLNNYSLRITTKGSSLDKKLQSILDGDRNYNLEKKGQFSMAPNKVSENQISDSYNGFTELEK